VLRGSEGALEYDDSSHLGRITEKRRGKKVSLRGKTDIYSREHP